MELLRLNTPRYFAPEEAADLEAYLDHHIEWYFVIEKEGRIIGSGGVNFTEDGRTGKISWDLLHPHFHGKGYGRKLTEYRLRKLRALQNIQIISVRTSQHVFRFYEKMGFELKEVMEDYWAPGFDLYRMQQEA